MNLGNTKYGIIRYIARKLMNFKCTRDEDEDWDLCWTDSNVPPEKLSRMKPYQKINHFPGMQILARKNHLARNLTKMTKLFPQEYNFFPPTWLLPAEGGDFRAQFNKKKAKTFIIKPEASCQGKGIFLTRNYEDLESDAHYVAQRYIHTPYLIDGKKIRVIKFMLFFRFEIRFTAVCSALWMQPNESVFV